MFHLPHLEVVCPTLPKQESVHLDEDVVQHPHRVVARVELAGDVAEPHHSGARDLAEDAMAPRGEPVDPAILHVLHDVAHVLVHAAPEEVLLVRQADRLGEGTTAVLLGPSGSGKSTFLNILGGLDHATSGTVRFRDHLLSGMSESNLTRYRRDHVGFVFQFYNLIPSLTAKENVALVTEIARRPMKPADALTIVGLEDRVDHFPAQLSGGEQQRVAIARGLVHDPLLVLADEPTGNLDSEIGTQILDLLEALTRSLGKTLLIATHSREIVARADYVWRIRDGKLVAETALREFAHGGSG